MRPAPCATGGPGTRCSDSGRCGRQHAAPSAASFDLREAARETAFRGLADGLIITGKATGSPACMTHIKVVREAVPDRPLLVGSGVTRETVKQTLRLADGSLWNGNQAGRQDGGARGPDPSAGTGSGGAELVA